MAALCFTISHILLPFFASKSHAVSFINLKVICNQTLVRTLYIFIIYVPTVSFIHNNLLLSLQNRAEKFTFLLITVYCFRLEIINFISPIFYHITQTSLIFHFKQYCLVNRGLREKHKQHENGYFSCHFFLVCHQENEKIFIPSMTSLLVSKYESPFMHSVVESCCHYFS